MGRENGVLLGYMGASRKEEGGSPGPIPVAL